MELFTKKCKHEWVFSCKSNAIQQDDMGYPLRLYIFKCVKCGECNQQWIDVAEEALEELKTGKSVLVTWEKVKF